MQKFLISRSKTEADLFRLMETNGTGVSRQFIHMLVRNQRAASPSMIERVGAALQLTIEERAVLHRAAALDSGYRIGRLR